jgi:hypothetical protein
VGGGVGAEVGSGVGLEEGSGVGAAVGNCEGGAEGDGDGAREGRGVGTSEGGRVGDGEGSGVGRRVWTKVRTERASTATPSSTARLRVKAGDTSASAISFATARCASAPLAAAATSKATPQTW